MKEEKIKELLETLIKSGALNPQIDELFKLYEKTAKRLKNPNSASLVKELYVTINQYDILLAFLCGLKDVKSGNLKIISILNGGLEEAVNTEKNFDIPQYRYAKKLLKEVCIQNQGDLIFDEISEYLSYINYEYIKTAYVCAVFSGGNRSTEKNLKYKKDIILGKKIKYCRQQAHLTKDKMGLLTGVDSSLLSKYENSLCSPTIEFILQFSKYFNVSFDDLTNDRLSLSKFKLKYPSEQFNLT